MGSQYVQVVAFSATLSIMLLLGAALGWQPGGFDLTVAALLTIVSTRGFVVLGKQLFDFFDPIRLARQVLPDLVDQIRAATPEGFQWLEPPFQRLAQQQAETSLLTYQSFVRIAIGEEHLRGRQLVRLITDLLNILQVYARAKQQIPTDSLWYPRVAQYDDWMTASSIKVSVALDAGTPLQPDLVPDIFWFETYVQEMVHSALQALFDQASQAALRHAVDIAGAELQALKAYGGCLAVDEAFRLLRLITPLFRAVGRDMAMPTQNDLQFEDRQEAMGLRLACTDVPGWMFLEILRSTTEMVESTRPESLAASIANIDWYRGMGVYTTGLPRPVVESLEALKKQLLFEITVDGSIVTPHWYWVQVGTRAVVRTASKAIAACMLEFETLFAPEAEYLISQQRYLFAAQQLERGLETCQRLSGYLQRLQTAIGALTASRHFDDGTWPSFDWAAYERQIQVVRERIIHLFAQSATQLATVPLSSYWPDFFGHAYSVLAQECYRSMAEGKDVLFKDVFVATFFATFHAHERTLLRLRERDQFLSFIYSTEPLETLLHLSGYARLYSDLDGKPYWGIVEKIWNAYLDREEESGKLAALWGEISEERAAVFSIHPRDVLRVRWKMDFEQRLRARGLLAEYSISPLFGQPYHIPLSPLLGVLTRNGTNRNLVYDAQEVFISTYLFLRMPPEAQSALRQARDLAWQIEQQGRRDQDGSHQEQPSTLEGRDPRAGRSRARRGGSRSRRSLGTQDQYLREKEEGSLEEPGSLLDRGGKEAE